MEEIKEIQSADPVPLPLLLLADPNEALIRSYWSRSAAYLLTVDGNEAGVVVLLPTRPETIEVVNVAVDEQYQGKGYGRKLVEFALKRAKADGYRTVEIGTGNSSVGQLSLYQKCGFRIVGVDRDFFIRHYDEPIYENGIQCRDMIRMQVDFCEPA